MEIELLTVNEVAEILKVSKSMIYTLVARKELDCIRIGVGRGTIRISAKELNAFIDTRSNYQQQESTRGDPVANLKILNLRNTT